MKEFENLPEQLRPGDFFEEMEICKPIDPDCLIYKNTFVALVDIIGYKNILKRHEKDTPRYIYQDLINTFSWIKSKYKALQCTLFSDTFLIEGLDDHSINFWNIVSLLTQLQFYFLLKGIMVRGAITFGEHFHKNSILISPALIDAHNLERETKFPRIVFDDIVYNLVTRDVFTFNDKKILKVDKYGVEVNLNLLLKDSDNNNVLSFIPSHVELDYLKYNCHPDMKNINNHKNHCVDVGNELLSKLKDQLLIIDSQAQKLTKHEKDKAFYLISRWNNYLEDFKNSHLLKDDYSI